MTPTPPNAEVEHTHAHTHTHTQVRASSRFCPAACRTCSVAPSLLRPTPRVAWSCLLLLHFTSSGSAQLCENDRATHAPESTNRILICQRWSRRRFFTLHALPLRRVLTQRIVREKYLEHVGRTELSKDEKTRLRDAVERAIDDFVSVTSVQLESLKCKGSKLNGGSVALLLVIQPTRRYHTREKLQ